MRSNFGVEPNFPPYLSEFPQIFLTWTTPPIPNLIIHIKKSILYKPGPIEATPHAGPHNPSPGGPNGGKLCDGSNEPGGLKTFVDFLRFFHLALRFWNHTCKLCRG